MKSVMQHTFSDIPNIDVPRSKFNRSHGLKTTFDAAELIPIMVEEVLPGDSFNCNANLFARLSTPIKALMDNLYLDVHFFFARNDQLWSNSRKFFGEQDDPGDSVDFQLPTIDINGAGEGSLADYFGLPIKTTSSLPVVSLPFRMYNSIYKHWYRDENLIDSPTIDTGDGPDTLANYTIRKRGKRKDYFTSALPWPQKGDAIDLPLGTVAPIQGTGAVTQVYNSVDSSKSFLQTNTSADVVIGSTPSGNGNLLFSSTGSEIGLQADLTNATAATINQIREAFQLQKMLEKDARSGTRYNEIVKGHFGVEYFDHPVRPEYLGGGTINVNINPVQQTSESGTTPQGNISAYGTMAGTDIGFTASFNCHGYVMAIASLRADLTYQQGVAKMWLRDIRESLYWPSLAHIGEQAIENQEIYFDSATPANNTLTFGYQERYAEYRYAPSRITGAFRSNYTSSLDVWHLSQEFGSLPALNQSFIEETPPMSRVLAVPTEPHVIMDVYFDLIQARPMPIYGVPGFIDHF